MKFCGASFVVVVGGGGGGGASSSIAFHCLGDKRHVYCIDSGVESAYTSFTLE